jgi:hypothetical protein
MNPPNPEGEDWARRFYSWFIQRTLAPVVPTFKRLEFGVDIPWVETPNPVSTYGLYLYKDHNEMVHVVGDVEIPDVDSGGKREAGPIPAEYIPSYSTSEVLISTAGWGLNTSNGNIEPAIIGLAYEVDGWYLSSRGDFSGSKTVPFQFLVDIIYPHKEVV